MKPIISYAFKLVVTLAASAMIVALALIPAQPALAAPTFYGLYFKGPVVNGGACTAGWAAVSVPIYQNVPNDGGTWTNTITHQIKDSVYSYTVTSAPGPLSPTAGVVFYATMLLINVPAGTPTMPYDLSFIYSTYRNGELMTKSRVTAHCVGGFVTSTSITNKSFVEDRCGGDGRLNAQSCPGPVALYCTKDTLENWWVDDQGKGHLDYTFSAWPKTAPAVNTLLMQTDHSSLWQLTTGEFQVNAPEAEGKMHVFIFNGCPYDGFGYYANIDPNE